MISANGVELQFEVQACLISQREDFSCADGGAGNAIPASLLLFFDISALQEPVVDTAAGRPSAGAAILVERLLLAQTCSRVPPCKSLEARWHSWKKILSVSNVTTGCVMVRLPDTAAHFLPSRHQASVMRPYLI